MARKLHQKEQIRITSKKPLLWFLIQLRYPTKQFEDTIFAYGDTIYSGRGVDLPQDMIVHEETHLRQMRYSKVYGLPIFIWYHLSKKFRLKCELEAYRNQMKIKGTKEDMAWYLSSPLYGPMISYNEALKLL